MTWGIYVSGQKVRCRRCGNKFAVVRNDTQFNANGGRAAPAARPEVNAKGRVKPATRPERGGQRGRPAQDKDLSPGTRLDGYEITGVLGKGAMGTVYKARQLSLERTVAVKVMASDLVGQPEFILRFRREAAALAALTHINVVSIIDQGNVGNHWYFVMEFVEGSTLRRELSRKSIILEQALDYVIQIGKGLTYAHQKGVVHRDLKPEKRASWPTTA